jgi:hypothetical protein
MVEWVGYAHRERGINMIYSVELDDYEFQKLWEKFKEAGSQEDFYFNYVNPTKLQHMTR